MARNTNSYTLTNFSHVYYKFNVSRSVDPHGLNRGRKLSVGHRGSTSGDHQLDALAEGPEDDDDSNSETDTMSTSPRVSILRGAHVTYNFNVFDSMLVLS